ncbi:hypothetical protein BJ322DRAFT_233934 [Thelephora terrestris]|uniref:CSC1/OSCA1-like 7TM region domain-containing protein n=1 Tax=Thelephora terrestris TaxID=56493 RepID=A0A9P6H891_9AGAM|nr:hypothetical protein BJ322DRAFT_233934 [Thelephora terrestris]
MATLDQRPFSKDYSGLVNQSAFALGLALVCVTFHDIMRRTRRGRGKDPRYEPGQLGSVETWEFGYLFQGRSWANNPSPRHPRGWPLSWVKEVVAFPEERMLALRGIDATLYVRFLRGCWWFALLHTFTTFPVLFPIHVIFSEGDGDSSASMTRASISSLTDTPKGKSLLWVHLIIILWISVTWMATLLWISLGLMRMRATNLLAAAENQSNRPETHFRHPHPQYFFQPAVEPTMRIDDQYRGVRYRTIMVANIPSYMRDERQLREYFEYYLSRKIAKPTTGINTSTQPGFINRWLTYFWNRLRRVPLDDNANPNLMAGSSEDGHTAESSGENGRTVGVERVTIVRRTSQLATLLERREEVLRVLETAHIRLACKVITAVAELMKDRPEAVLAKRRSIHRRKSTPLLGNIKFWKNEKNDNDVEDGAGAEEQEGENRADLLVRTIGPFVQKFSRERRLPPFPRDSSCKKPHEQASKGDGQDGSDQINDNHEKHKTIWDALLSLPRSVLDPYQPLIHLNSLFRGKAVPTIDYYTAKLRVLTSLIVESPKNARRACKYLAVHPNKPHLCTVSMAPLYEDIDWTRIMKLPYNLEFVKDWVISLGVWAFTIFWVFPISLFVGLVSIQNISAFWPSLKNYLNKHEWQSEVIQSFLPTFLVSVLAILIPLLLLLIAKKAHTIITLSALHDLIMTRYYKFLVVNLLVFFCVGTAALQSFLVSIKSYTDGTVIETVSNSFPSAGPFYVGWLIFTTAIHCGFDLALLGLPLLVYPATRRQVTPRKRTVGIRPRTFNYYYWLPNHILIIHILLLFSVLNPLVIPFGLFYFTVSNTIVKNSLLHVYAKHYEGNGQILLIRIIRYTLDGLILSQAVFLAYMVVNRYTVNVVFSGVFIVCTAVFKMVFTRWCRERFEIDDIREANIYCETNDCEIENVEGSADGGCRPGGEQGVSHTSRASRKEGIFSTWKLPRKLQFSYSTIPNRTTARRQPNPFAPPATPPPGPRTTSMQRDRGGVGMSPITEEQVHMEEMRSAPSLGDRESEVRADDRDREGEQRWEAEYNDFPPSCRVTINPPHPPWDDNSLPDQPYDNPYYTLPIKDALWLPMNPIGILDLDMTVTMDVALTSEPGAGHVGPLRERLTSVGSVLSGLTADLESATSISGDEMSTNGAPLDGTEDIELSPTIASRVQNLRNDDDVSTPGQQSDLLRTTRPRPKTSGSATSQTRRFGADLLTGSVTRLPLALSLPNSPQAPQITTSEVPPTSPSLLTGSLRSMSTGPLLRTTESADWRTYPRHASMDEGGRLTVQRPMQTPLQRRRSLNQMHSANSIGQNSFLPPPSGIGSRFAQRSMISQVSAQSVAIQEALTEETEVLQRSHILLQEEAEKQNAPRSWWTSWAFKKRE